jgi:hypothetical protein
MSQEDILKFAQKQGYDNIEYVEEWRGYQVYAPIFNSKEMLYIGLPYVILVKDNEIRMSTPDESLERLDDIDEEEEE